MKVVKSFILISILLLSLPMMTAQMNPPGDHHSRHHGSDFRNMDGNMNISGEIVINDAIQISLSAKPDDQNSDQRHHMDFSNEIIVSISKLVEYEDHDGNDYSPNDTIVSEFMLNTDTLDEISEISEGGTTTYMVTSSNGIFNMTIHIVEDQGISHGWKWSMSLHYNFQSNTSKLGLIHTITSNNNMSIHHQEMETSSEGYGRINHTRFMDQNQNMPMYFSWDDKAIIDNVESQVNATYVNEFVVLNFLQGEEIDYDPEIGVDLDTINNANTILMEEQRQFFETIVSPTSLGLIIAISLVGMSIFLISRPMRR